MDEDTDTPRSRRSVMAAAVGIGLAGAASALAHVTPATAADDDTVLVGHSYTASSPTSISNEGATAIVGTSVTGVGIFAQSKSLPGDTAFQGKIGVRAQAFHDTGSIGVLAETTSGQAVRGVAMTSGVGGYFTSATGTALEVAGKAKLSRSGKARIAPGAASVYVTVPGGLSGTPLAFANLLSYRSGVHVAAVSVSASTGKIRIRLNKVASSSASTYVAWMVLS
jgi:hypothetical protein